MADKGHNYTVERRRLELQLLEHEDTIARGRTRVDEIARAKKTNIARAELANMELDSESARIQDNETALGARIAELRTNLDLMVKETSGG